MRYELISVAGRLTPSEKVLIAMMVSLLGDEVGSTDEASAYREYVCESDGAVDGCDPSVRGDGVLD